MGDVAMSVPILRAFTQQNPHVKVTVLSKAFLKPLFENIENVDFYTADVKGKHKGLFGLYRLSKELKQLNIDAIADIHNVLRSKILRFFFSLKRIKSAVIDKGRAEKKALTRTKNKVFKQLKTSHERYADVFRKLGFTIDLTNPEFPKKKELANFPLPLGRVRDGKWIGIAPFAQYESKMYPLDLIEVVISKLTATNQHKVFLFGGGKKEINILNSLENNHQNTISVVGKLSLNDELHLIANLDCMLSMDSANSHLAAMQNVKTITLWGITHPYAGFAPFNQPKENMLLPDLEKYPNIPCSIYGNTVCDGYEDVMRSISPEKVVEKIMNIS
ncbi:MAG: glycosyltransferase family 9 protein [Flavobacteriaceae bacterium]|nr:glycosyltransferase family 9 protein [Flavobacteriaceae bacterium]